MTYVQPNQNEYDNLFTIGYTTSYEEVLERDGVVYKTGKHDECERFPHGYCGGCIFIFKEDAELYLKNNKLVGYSIYGLKTKNSNIYWNIDEKTYCLIDKAQITKV